MDRCADWIDLDIEEWKELYLNEMTLDLLDPDKSDYNYIRGNGWVFKEGINKGKLNLFYVKFATGFDDSEIYERIPRDKDIFIKEVYNPLIGYLLKEKIIKPPFKENIPEYQEAIDFIIGNISSPPIGFYDKTPSYQYKKEQENIRDGVGGGKRKTKRREKKRKKRKTKRKKTKRNK